jgi:hypothetical protein
LQTEFAADPPKHHERDHRARVLRAVRQATAPFVELHRALSEVMMKRGSASPPVASALPMTRRFRLQLPRVM